MLLIDDEDSRTPSSCNPLRESKDMAMKVRKAELLRKIRRAISHGVSAAVGHGIELRVHQCGVGLN